MERKILSVEDVTQNKVFQNWLFSNFVLYRRELTDEDVRLRGKSIGKGQTAERIHNLLIVNQGYLLSTRMIADRIYNQSSDAEVAAIIAWMSRLRNHRLQDPTSLFVARGIGWSIGVTSMPLSADGFLFTYRLWQELLHPVPERELAYSIYGFTDESALLSVRRQAAKLRLYEFPKTLLRLIADRSTNQNEIQYRLSHIYTDEVKSFLNLRYPKYLTLDFQNWLVSVGLIKRHDQYVDEGVRFFSKERKDHQLLDMLYKSYGYIVPYTVLSQKLYGSESEIKKVREIFSYAKDTGLIDPKEVCVVPEVGIAVGIQHVSLSLKQLQLMYQLWSDDQGHYMDDLGMSVYGDFNAQIKLKLTSLISHTRKVLHNSDHDIKGYKGMDGLKFRLEKKHNI